MSDYSQEQTVSKLFNGALCKSTTNRINLNGARGGWGVSVYKDQLEETSAW